MVPRRIDIPIDEDEELPELPFPTTLVVGGPGDPHFTHFCASQRCSFRGGHDLESLLLEHRDGSEVLPVGSPANDRIGFNDAPSPVPYGL